MLDFLGRLKRTEHHFCQENLSSYIDRQLSPRAQERVQRHLEGCQDCRWDLESLQRTVALLRAMPRPKAPRSFAIPESAPAPFVPFWMRPGAYAALRTATATVAALFVITVAGNALAGPALTASAPAGDVRLSAYTEAAATAPVQAPMAPAAKSGALPNDTPAAPAAQSTGALPNDTPVAMLGANAATPPPAPTTAPADATGPVPLGQPTLTAEEATRRASAPSGKGGGVVQPTAELVGTPDGRGAAGPEPTPLDGPPVGFGAGEPTQPAVTPTAEMIGLGAGAPEPTPTPAEVARALGGLPEQPTARAGETTEVERGQASATAAADVDHFAQPPARDALQDARLRLATYPWQALMIVMAAVLAGLVAATLWLRSARSRWP